MLCAEVDRDALRDGCYSLEYTEDGEAFEGYGAWLFGKWKADLPPTRISLPRPQIKRNNLNDHLRRGHRPPLQHTGKK